MSMSVAEMIKIMERYPAQSSKRKEVRCNETQRECACVCIQVDEWLGREVNVALLFFCHGDKHLLKYTQTHT
jgi:hypothetical protein